MKGEGAHLWDADGNRYIDYMQPSPRTFSDTMIQSVNEAVLSVLKSGDGLYGSGTTRLEGGLTELICHNVPCVESVQFLNTGSEATYQAIRLARAVTGRDNVVVMQGCYNGWHNDMACDFFF